MPLYQFHCPAGCCFDRFLTLRQHQDQQTCDTHGYAVTQIISAPLLVKAAADICYDSPIDGRPITSWDQHQEDLKRNNCQRYDPEQKTDYLRRQRESEVALDRAIDEHVESTVEKMPTAKRAKLWSELTEQGITADVVRGTKAT